MLLNTVKINARCLALVKEMVAKVGGRTHFTRTELRKLHKELRGKTGAPYFICKNLQCRPSAKDAKRLGKNIFIVDRLLTHAKKHPPEPMPVKEAPARKEAKPKREVAAKKTAARKGAKPVRQHRIAA